MKKIILIATLIFHTYCFSQTNIDLLKSIEEFTQQSNNDFKIKHDLWEDHINPRQYQGLISTQRIAPIEPSYIITAYNRTSKKGSWDSIIVTYDAISTSDRLSRENTMSIYKEICTIFGEPHETLDYGFFKKPSKRYSSVFQWNLKNYSLEVSFRDSDYISGKPSVERVILTVEPKGSLKTLVPLSAKRITFNSGTSKNDNQLQELKPNEYAKFKQFEFIVDQYEDQILGMNFIPVGLIKENTPKTLTINLGNMFITNGKITINKKNNEAKTELYNLDDPKQMLILNGPIKNIKIP